MSNNTGTTKIIEKKPINILLVEDNPVDEKYIQELLKEVKFNFNLQIVNNLASAIDLLKKDDIDIILLDFNLPDSRGLETFNAIVLIAGSKPIVIITELKDEYLIEYTLKKGAQEYIMKSKLSSEYLSNVILYCIEKSQLQHDL